MKRALEETFPPYMPESFQFRILCDHLQCEEASLLAEGYANSSRPYSDTMVALENRYGKPHKVAMQRMHELTSGPSIRGSDTEAFRLFALKVRSLVCMLTMLGREGEPELACGSHVIQLLQKLTPHMESSFRRFIYPRHVSVPSLVDLSEWLEFETQVLADRPQTHPVRDRHSPPRNHPRRIDREPSWRQATIMHGAVDTSGSGDHTRGGQEDGGKLLYPYCKTTRHHLGNCMDFGRLTTGQKHD